MPQTDINHADIRTRFIFDDMPVRGLHVRLENVWEHIAGQKHYPAAIRRALGELLAAGALLSSNLKNEGTLIVQVQGQGRLKMLVVEATSDNTVRATARWDEAADIRDDESLTDLLGSNSVFVLTHQPKDAEPWQGVVPLEGDNIAQMLMNYIKRSEQLDTHIVLSASDHVSGGIAGTTSARRRTGHRIVGTHQHPDPNTDTRRANHPRRTTRSLSTLS